MMSLAMNNAHLSEHALFSSPFSSPWDGRCSNNLAFVVRTLLIIADTQSLILPLFITLPVSKILRGINDPMVPKPPTQIDGMVCQTSAINQLLAYCKKSATNVFEIKWFLLNQTSNLAKAPSKQPGQISRGKGGCIKCDLQKAKKERLSKYGHLEHC